MSQSHTWMSLVGTVDARNMEYYGHVTYIMTVRGLRKKARNSSAWHKRLSQCPTNYLSLLVCLFLSSHIRPVTFLVIPCTLSPACVAPFHWNVFLCLPYLPGKHLLQAICYLYRDPYRVSLAAKYFNSVHSYTQIMGLKIICLQVCLHNAEPIRTQMRRTASST